MTLQGITRQTLREQVWSNLRSAILEGRLAAGTRLGEVSLSEQLGVSRGTIREALRLLQQSGLVVGEDRTGLSVAAFTATEVVELYEVRGALESLAAVRIVDSGRYMEIADQLEQKLPVFREDSTLTERLDVDLGFHEALCEAAGNTMLLNMWRELQDRVRVAVLADQSHERLSLMQSDYHRPIIDGLRSGNPEQARLAIVNHMNHSGRAWQEKVDLLG